MSEDWTGEWLVVRDASGHHRAVHPRVAAVDGRRLVGDAVVGRAEDYYQACKVSGELNAVAEVMEA